MKDLVIRDCNNSKMNGLVKGFPKRSSVICKGAYPSLPAALVCVYFKEGELEISCTSCLATFFVSSVHSCALCKRWYCNDCVNLKNDVKWMHVDMLCDKYCQYVFKDAHRYYLICQTGCHQIFLQNYICSDPIETRGMSVGPDKVLDNFTRPNSFVYSNEKDNPDSFFSRRISLECVGETSYECVDCSVMFPACKMLACDRCLTVLCHACARLRYMYHVAKFVHRDYWCVCCRYILNKMKGSCIHLNFFVCTYVCETELNLISA